MPESLWNEALFTSSNWNPLLINNERVAALHHDHVFVEIMHMRRGLRGFAACPERHLAPVRSVKNVTFNSRGGFTAYRYPVRRALHEFWEVVHRISLTRAILLLK